MNGNAWVGWGCPAGRALSRWHSRRADADRAGDRERTRGERDRADPESGVPALTPGHVTLPHVSSWILLSQRLLKALCFCTAPCGAVRRVVHDHSRLVPLLLFALGRILFLTKS